MAQEPRTHEHETTTPPERENHVREREVIVTNGGERRSSAAGLIMGLLALAIVVIIAVVGFGLLDSVGGDGEGPSIDVPSQVDVNVPDTDEGGGS